MTWLSRVTSDEMNGVFEPCESCTRSIVIGHRVLDCVIIEDRSIVRAVRLGDMS